MKLGNNSCFSGIILILIAVKSLLTANMLTNVEHIVLFGTLSEVMLRFTDQTNHQVCISVWKQAIHPKKWRENFPASKIAFLFMA